MLYKFDILFKKELKGGGLKVVTYSQLLEHPDTFGGGETLECAVGTLSLTDSDKEKVHCLSSTAPNWWDITGQKCLEKISHFSSLSTNQMM